MMYNPRFPHTLRVMRVRKNSYGEPATDDNGHPIFDTVPLAKVVMRGDSPVIGADGRFETEMVETISYGYRSQGKDTRDSADVESSDYKLATPMFLTPLDSSDIILMTDYDRTFKGEVVRKATFNLGSNIWVNEVRG